MEMQKSIGLRGRYILLIAIIVSVLIGLFSWQILRIEEDQFKTIVKRYASRPASAMWAEESEKALEALRIRVVVISILTAIAIVLSSGIIVTILVKRPIDSLIRNMKAAEHRDYKVCFGANRTDEIGILARGFNSMASEFERVRNDVDRCHQKELSRMERMAALGEIATGIAHEIKNPLAGISGAVQVIAEDLQENDPRKEIIAEVLKQIERLDKTVKELILLARPQEPHKVPFQINEIIKQVEAGIQQDGIKQGVKIITRLDSSIPEIEIDVEQMYQAFLCLSMNAICSMTDGGILEIWTNFSPLDRLVKIYFSDTGQVIRGKTGVFKPFSSDARSLTTGFSLAITYNIIESHHGDILLESKPGIGSIFIVRLPVKEGSYA